MTTRFEPVIIGFLCNWCSYAGADMAGVGRIQYPSNLLPIRVMCTGMVPPDLVMEAFSSGADGVLVMGCHPGECRYVDGNATAWSRKGVIVTVMDNIGMDPRRFAIQWISSAEASVFAKKVAEFTDKIRTMGPCRIQAENPYAGRIK